MAALAAAAKWAKMERFDWSITIGSIVALNLSAPSRVFESPADFLMKTIEKALQIAKFKGVLHSFKIGFGKIFGNWEFCCKALTNHSKLCS